MTYAFYEKMSQKKEVFFLSFFLCQNDLFFFFCKYALDDTNFKLKTMKNASFSKVKTLRFQIQHRLVWECLLSST